MILQIFAIAFMVITIATAFFLSFYIFVLFLEPQDNTKEAKWALRILIVGGIGISFVVMFWVPIDFLMAYKAKGLMFGIDFINVDIWPYLFLMLFFLMLVNLFGSKYIAQYHKETRLMKIASASRDPITLMVVYVAMVGLLVLQKSSAQISLDSYVITSLELLDCEAVFTRQEVKPLRIQYSPPFIVNFLMPLLFLGSLCFSIFGAAGMAMLPIEMIRKFIDRPVVPDPGDKEGVAKLVLMRRVLRQETEELIKSGTQLFHTKEDYTKKKLKRFELARMEMNLQNQEKSLLVRTERLYSLIEYVKMCDGTIESSPVDHFINLLLALLFGVFSLFFFVDNILCIKHPYRIFDDWLLWWLRYNPILAQIVFILNSILFSISSNIGYFKFTQLVEPRMTVHQFRKNGTWLDSFLVYNNIVILSLIGYLIHVAKFCPKYFGQTNFYTFLNEVVSEMSVFGALYVYRVFELIFVIFYVFCILTAFYSPTIEFRLKKMIKKEKERLSRAKLNLEQLEKNTEDPTRERMTVATHKEQQKLLKKAKEKAAAKPKPPPYNKFAVPRSEAKRREEEEQRKKRDSTISAYARPSVDEHARSANEDD